MCRQNNRGVILLINFPDCLAHSILNHNIKTNCWLIQISITRLWGTILVKSDWARAVKP